MEDKTGRVKREGGALSLKGVLSAICVGLFWSEEGRRDINYSFWCGLGAVILNLFQDLGVQHAVGKGYKLEVLDRFQETH